MRIKITSILFFLLIISCQTNELVIDTDATKKNELTFSGLEINFDPESGDATIKMKNVIKDDYYLNLVNNSLLFKEEFSLRSFRFIEENYKTTFGGSITIEIKIKANRPGNDNVRENIEDIITKFTKKKVNVGSDFSYEYGFDKIILIFKEDNKNIYKKGNATNILYNDKTKQIALVYNIVNKPIKFKVSIKN